MKGHIEALTEAPANPEKALNPLLTVLVVPMSRQLNQIINTEENKSMGNLVIPLEVTMLFSEWPVSHFALFSLLVFGLFTAGCTETKELPYGIVTVIHLVQGCSAPSPQLRSGPRSNVIWPTGLPTGPKIWSWSIDN